MAAPTNRRQTADTFAKLKQQDTAWIASQIEAYETLACGYVVAKPTRVVW